MTLYCTNNFSNLLAALSRVRYTASTSLNEMQCIRRAVMHQNRMKNFHITSIRRYPDPPTLPLPTNVSEIFANETGRFTPERARDIAAPVLLYDRNDCKSFFSEKLTKSSERSCRLENSSSDTHVDSYDCFGAVSLNSTMQSNVPKPFSSNGKSTHLNMPGGQWARDEKYIAEDMQKSHYRSICIPQLKLEKNGLANHVATNILFHTNKLSYTSIMKYTTKVPEPLNGLTTSDDKKQKKFHELSKKEKFKIIVKDYGITVIVFHVGISLISLGACYTAVAGGIDLEPVINQMFSIESKEVSNIFNQSSTILIAYTIHKLMAPLRLSITFAVAPFLVIYLRKLGVLKKK